MLFLLLLFRDFFSYSFFTYFRVISCVLWSVFSSLLSSCFFFRALSCVSWSIRLIFFFSCFFVCFVVYSSYLLFFVFFRVFRGLLSSLHSVVFLPSPFPLQILLKIFNSPGQTLIQINLWLPIQLLLSQTNIWLALPGIVIRKRLFVAPFDILCFSNQLC